MSDQASFLPRIDLHLRLQHGLLAGFALAALGTGLPLGPAFGEALRGAPAVLGRIHVWSGLAAAGVLVYHLAYLSVIGYVEGRAWDSFPVRWGSAEWRSAAAEIGYLVGRRAERPEADDFRVSQKAMYWTTLLCLSASGLTGLLMAFWEHLGTLGGLGLLSEIHRGSALLLMAALLWHLYGAFVWDGSWQPEWSWVTGKMETGKAGRKLPGFHRRAMQEAEERAAALQGKGAEAVEAERRLQEVDEVQRELSRGNQFALEERFVEALFHYRRALELYPGYSQARYNMARVLARMGEIDMAREAYVRFVEAEPFHPLAEKAREALRELEEGTPR